MKKTSGIVDVLVVGNVCFSDVAKALYGSQTALRREVSPKIFSKEEWIQMRENDDLFVRELLSKPRLLIVGSENEHG